MITLKQWMETVDYRITEGSDYGWNCFGPNAYCLDSWNGDHNGHSFCIIFDTKTQEVYEVQAHDYKNNQAYRVINPDYKTAYKDEASVRNAWMNEAYEGVDYVNLEVDDDWLEKATAIFNGVDYDTRVSVPLNIPEDELMVLFKLAHERDITFNQLVVEALEEAIKEFNTDPDTFASRWKDENDAT